MSGLKLRRDLTEIRTQMDVVQLAIFKTQPTVSMTQPKITKFTTWPNPTYSCKFFIIANSNSRLLLSLLTHEYMQIRQTFRLLDPIPPDPTGYTDQSDSYPVLGKDVILTVF